MKETPKEMKTEIYRKSSGLSNLTVSQRAGMGHVPASVKQTESNLGDFSQYVGVAAMKNARPYMEDHYDVVCHAERKGKGDSTTPSLHYFAVFDGHGGQKTSRHLSQKLIDDVAATEAFSAGELGEAVEQGFAVCDQRLMDIARSTPGLDDGSCACTVWLRGDVLMVANVGDSRAVLSSGGQAVPLSNDHKPNRPDERRRIQSHGGFVQTLGVPRVNGVLAVSRAFGDTTLKPYVTAAPEIAEVELGDVGEDEFVVVASDGLWDVFSNQEAVDLIHKLVKQEGSYEAASRVLTTRAQSKGSGDNICVIILNLDIREITDA